jgi:four helix bundle protein
MGSIASFTDLNCWKLSKEISLQIYRESLNGAISKDYQYSNQIRRAALSMMNNVAEGFDRYNPKEFMRFLNYSIGSCGEVISMIHLGVDLGYFKDKEAQLILAKCDKLKGQLITLKNVQARRF